MKSASLLPAVVVLLAACATPSPSCPTPGQSECSETCFDLQSDAMNCGACGAVCGASRLPGRKMFLERLPRAGRLRRCWVAGSRGICSETAPRLLPPSSRPRRVMGRSAVSRLPGRPVHGTNILWLLDTENNQLDVEDVAKWPPPP